MKKEKRLQMKKTKRADKLVIKAAAAAFVLFGLEAIGFTIALIIRSVI